MGSSMSSISGGGGGARFLSHFFHFTLQIPRVRRYRRAALDAMQVGCVVLDEARSDPAPVGREFGS